MSEPFLALPGTIVECDGDLFLVERVRVHLTMQRIESHVDLIDRMIETGQPQAAPCPVFHRVEDEIGGPMLSKLTPYLPKDSSK